MEYINIEKNIRMFPNFISQEFANKILSIVESTSQEDWDLYTNKPRDNKNEWSDRILLMNEIPWIKNLVGSELDDLYQKTKNAINMTLNKQYEMTTINALHRTRIGEKMNPHYDGGFGPTFKAGAVIYLNDNFSGGEIYYSNLNLSSFNLSNIPLLLPILLTISFSSSLIFFLCSLSVSFSKIVSSLENSSLSTTSIGSTNSSTNSGK